MYVKRFIRDYCDKDMECCDPMVEEVFVDIFLHGMMEEYNSFWKIFHFPHFPG